MLSRCTPALISLFLVCACAVARAQTVPVEPGTAAAGPTIEKQGEAPTPKQRPMNRYAFGVMLGMAKVGAGKVKNPYYTPELVQAASVLSAAQRAQLEGRGCSLLEKHCRTRARFGLQLSLPIQLGGEGVSFHFEPMFGFADGARSYGLYFGPAFHFHVYQNLYLGFGVGVKGAWVKADEWRYAGDVFGRIPLTVTYYLIDDLALVANFGFGFGVSGYYTDRVLRDPRNNKPIEAPDVTFGVAGTWDLSFGVRFP